MRQLKISQSITNRDSQSLDKYLNDISKIPMISPDEEVTLTRLIRAGDQAALDKLARLLTSTVPPLAASKLPIGTKVITREEATA